MPTVVEETGIGGLSKEEEDLIREFRDIKDYRAKIAVDIKRTLIATINTDNLRSFCFYWAERLCLDEIDLFVLFERYRKVDYGADINHMVQLLTDRIHKVGDL